MAAAASRCARDERGYTAAGRAAVIEYRAASGAAVNERGHTAASGAAAIESIDHRSLLLLLLPLLLLLLNLPGFSSRRFSHGLPAAARPAAPAAPVPAIFPRGAPPPDPFADDDDRRRPPPRLVADCIAVNRRSCHRWSSLESSLRRRRSPPPPPPPPPSCCAAAAPVRRAIRGPNGPSDASRFGVRAHSGACRRAHGACAHFAHAGSDGEAEGGVRPRPSVLARVPLRVPGGGRPRTRGVEELQRVLPHPPARVLHVPSDPSRPVPSR